MDGKEPIPSRNRSIVKLESIKSLICKGSKDGHCRLASFFLILEIISFTLDLLGRNQISFLLAQFILSSLVFGITFYVYFVKERNINKSVAEKQLIGEEIGFAIVQFVITLICLICKANYNASVFPLIFAAVSVCFAFKRVEEVSDSLPQYVSPNTSQQVTVIASDQIHEDTSSNNSMVSGRSQREPNELRQRRQKEGSEEHTQPPSHFICPIFQEVMHNPIVAADGFTYEGEALKGWLDSGHDTSPMTNLRLSHKILVPNHVLRSAIQEWLQHR